MTSSYSEDGQLVTGTLMDYALPKADQLPFFETNRTETPSPVNPLGVKGAGETGTVASTAAVANAVYDAVGVRIRDLPVTPEKIVGPTKLPLGKPSTFTFLPSSRTLACLEPDSMSFSTLSRDSLVIRGAMSGLLMPAPVVSFLVLSTISGTQC